MPDFPGPLRTLCLPVGGELVKRFRTMLGWSLVCVLLIGGACGGGSGSSDSGGDDGCTADPLEGVGGFWAVQETTSSQDCGSELNQFTTRITQTDEPLIVLGRATSTFAGTR